MRRWLSVIFILVLVSVLFVTHDTSSSVFAQTDFCREAESIAYGDSVNGSITDALALQAYCFNGRAGDEITITVSVTSGNLQALVYIFDPTLEDLHTSNFEDGASRFVSLEYTVPAGGQYLIAVSREGFDEGTTTGSFLLSLNVAGAGSGPGLGNPQDALVFNVTCSVGGQTTQEVRGGIQFSFINVNPGFSYTVTVFGLDGFDPVLAVEHGEGIGTCNDDEPAAAGSELAVPGFGYAEANTRTAQVRFQVRRQGDPVNITVGAFGGNSGQFVMVLEGLAISPSTELDGFVIRVPSSVAEEPIAVYMISRYNSLDSILTVGQGPGLNQAFDDDTGDFMPNAIDYNDVFIVAECDDAGSGDCADTPAFPARTGVDIANGSLYLGSSTDAGIVLMPNSSDPLLYVFGSYDGRSAGEYAIMVIGNVPGER